MIFLYMFIVPISTVYIHIDEMYTTRLMRFAFDNSWNTIINDVHPPLYYLIYMGILYFLKILNISFDMIQVSKFISIIPYGLIILVSLTKIRKDYNWLVAGLFAISIAIMGHSFIQFLTIRMYSWGLLFLVLSFIYVGDVYKKFDVKSWILFTLFSILSIYTHNIILISTGIIYFILLLHIYLLNININKKIKYIKMWLISIVILGLSYLPWLFVLLNQMAGGHSNGAQGMTLSIFFNCLFGFATMEKNYLIYAIVFLFLLFICVIIFYAYYKEKNVENSYLVMGLLTFFVTLILSATILPLIFGTVIPRYLVPIYGVLWLTISIFIGDLDYFKLKVNNNKVLNTNNLLLIFIVFLLILGSIGSISLNNTINSQYEMGKTEETTLEQINNNNSIVIFNIGWYPVFYKFYINNTQYVVLNPSNKTAFENNITQIMIDNPDKKVYLLFRLTDSNKNESKFTGIDTRLLSRNGNSHIYSTYLKNNTNITN